MFVRRRLKLPTVGQQAIAVSDELAKHVDGFERVLIPSGKPVPDHQHLTCKEVIRQTIAPKVPGRRNAA